MRGGGGGAYARDKDTSAGLWAKNAGGGGGGVMRERGAYLWDLFLVKLTLVYSFSAFHCSYISKNVVFSEKAVFTH